MKKALRALALVAIMAFAAAPAFATPADSAKKALPVITINAAPRAHNDPAIGVTAKGDTVFRGSRGGEYYFANGKKRYIPH